MANPSFYHTKNYNPDAEKIDFVIWGQYKGNKNGYPTITQIDIGKFSHENPQSSEQNLETLEIKNISLIKQTTPLDPKDIKKGNYLGNQIGEEFNKCIELLLESNESNQQPETKHHETKHHEKNNFDLKDASGNFLLWGHIERGFMSNVSGKFSMKDRKNTLSILNANITDHSRDGSRVEKRKIVDMGSPSDDEILGEDQLDCFNDDDHDFKYIKLKEVGSTSYTENIDSTKINNWFKEEEKEEKEEKEEEEKEEKEEKEEEEKEKEEEDHELHQGSISSVIDFNEIHKPHGVIVGSNMISIDGENPYFEEYLKSYQQFFEKYKSYFHKSNIDITNPTYYKKDVYNQFTFKDVLKEHEKNIRYNESLTNLGDAETTYEKCLVLYYKQIKEIKGNFVKENTGEDNIYVIIVFYLQNGNVYYMITDETKIEDLNRTTNLPRITEKLMLDKPIGDGFQNKVFTIGTEEKDDEEFIEQQYDNFIKYDPGILGNTITIEPYLIINNNLEFSFDYLYVKTGQKNNKKEFFIKMDKENINMIPDHRVVHVNGESVTKVFRDTNNFIKVGNDDRHLVFGGAKKRRSKRKKSKSKNTTLRR